MANIKYNFGVKALAFYNRTTFKPLGVFRVIASAEFTREIEQMMLEGGHHNGPWAVEAGTVTHSLTATLREFPNFSYTELDTATLTTGADASGFIGTITNKSGTSVVNATTGIASVSITSGQGAKLPLGKIIVVAASATTVDIYLLGDTATGGIPVTNELPLLQAGVTIANTGATVALSDYGITITSGSGTVAMTEGDVAIFETRPTNTSYSKITLGDSSDLVNVGCVLIYPKNSLGQQKIVDMPKVTLGGIPFSATSREFAEFELAMTPLYDEDAGKIFDITYLEVA